MTIYYFQCRALHPGNTQLAMLSHLLQRFLAEGAISSSTYFYIPQSDSLLTLSLADMTNGHISFPCATMTNESKKNGKGRRREIFSIHDLN
jgi:hypothetical protein